MPAPCIVLIAAPDLLPALKERASADGADVLGFADTDALRALETIMRRQPSSVLLAQPFAATPRGAALIDRIKADPTIVGCTVRVIARDADPPRSASDGKPAPRLDPDVPLDADGTRRAPRVAIKGGIEVQVDGNPATLVDLSVNGAQVLSATVLKPNQRVRVILTDESGAWRAVGTIAWASFEIPPRYRAGIEFSEADSAALRALCAKHQA